MGLSRMALTSAALAATLALSACYEDGYGYGGGVAVGYGPAGYGDPYYDGGYYGWYNDYYYPGYGHYVYDYNRHPRRWNGYERRYWSGRGRGYAGPRGNGGNWDRFDHRPPPGAGFRNGGNFRNGGGGRHHR